MSAKEKAKKEPPSEGPSASPRRGRPPSPKARKYSWYRELEGFQVHAAGSDKVWWETIDWVKNRKADKAARFFEAPEADLKRVLPGFLWETARRHPDMKELLDLWNHITGEDLNHCNLGSDGKSPGEALAMFGERDQKQVHLLNRYGMNVYDALGVLCTEWKLDYESLGKEEKERWLNSHQDLWHQIGEPGSVPAMPVDLPQEEGPDVGRWYGQGITAYELLIETNKGQQGSGERFVPQPLPSVGLDLFAIQSLDGLKRRRKNLEALGPREVLPHEFADPRSYPWVSIGRLDNRLARTRLSHLLLAVDLSKNDEAILRDLMHIIKRKRGLLGVKVAARRIRKESFEKIAELDKQVLGGGDAPPLMVTCNEFEDSARLDFQPLNNFLKQLIDIPYDSNAESETFENKIELIRSLEEPIRTAHEVSDQSKVLGLLTGKRVPDNLIRGLET